MSTNLVESQDICKLSMKVCECLDKRNTNHQLFKKLLTKHSLQHFHHVINEVLYCFTCEEIVEPKAITSVFLWNLKDDFLNLYLRTSGTIQGTESIYDLVESLFRREEYMEYFLCLKNSSKIMMKYDIGFSSKNYIDVFYDLMDFYFECESAKNNWFYENIQ